MGSVPKLENQNEFDWLYLEKQTQGIFDQQLSSTDTFDHLINNFLEIDQCKPPYQKNHITHFEFSDFEDINGDISSWNVNIPSFYEGYTLDPKLLCPVGENSFDQMGSFGSVESEFPDGIQRDFSSSSGSSGRGKLGKAVEAKELKVGLTVLKKRCRELNIMRWPHRKIKSLKSLIHNVKELGLTTEIEMLEEHRRMLEKLPELELTERTKKLRQACFKANYKKRRSLAALTY
ncbi:RWP-RK domain-containing protein [Actinidia rufa]|uniref:RWP-RK domain-containing protein n=1 Tax=Actinidia rufa TaxID=165716 RepID=A0A7J0EC71_9ERIC|nr:RWP-RK domain-containing protein [Actinidia rufa]